VDVIRTIRPGKPGSTRFLQHWGDRLVAVRYRKDNEAGKLYTTIEIIVDERELPPEGVRFSQHRTVRRNTVVAGPIHYEEYDLRMQAKQYGAR
jgi:2'-5' RNA ligase